MKLYARNKATGQHILLDPRIPMPYQLPPTLAEWEQLEADDEGWIPWVAKEGSNSPLPNITGLQWADMKLSDGVVVNSVHSWGAIPNPDRRVVAYRPINHGGDGQIVEQDTSQFDVDWFGKGENPPTGTVCRIEVFNATGWEMLDFDYRIDYIGKSVVVATVANAPREVERVFTSKVNFYPTKKAMIAEQEKQKEEKAVVQMVNIFEKNHSFRDIHHAIKRGDIEI